jgi:uncharacterized membrane protein
MLRTLFDSAGEFNAARLVLLSSWSEWMIAILALVTIGVLWLAHHNTSELAPTKRRTLFGLRAAAVGLVWLLLLQPGVRLEDLSTVRNHVVVLVDESRSMDLPAKDDSSRLDQVKALFQRESSTITEWKRAHQVDLFGLSDHARPIGTIKELQPNGDATRLVSGLEEIAARYKRDDLAAVVIASDGADNGALAGKSRLPPAAKAAIDRLGVPIHTVFTGPDDAPADIIITRVAYDDFAFVRNAVSIEATVKVHGFKSQTVPVVLKYRQGSGSGEATPQKILGVRTLQIDPKKSEYTFEFEFVPDETGKSVFTLEIQPPPGEKITVNNQRNFVIRVIRDKIRVLQVVGQPSWDERFLRKLLKKNPNVDLISFFILRTSASVDPARKDELSLIPFPTRELFEEQLGSFDLIIFQNFTYRGYRMRQYLPLIRDYVKAGGGFIMVGGELSFANGGYSGTPIAEFLPVTLPSDRTDLVWSGIYSPTLTKSGRFHPITILSHSPDESAAAWRALPTLAGMNRVLGAHPEANVLLEHPTRKAGGVPAPIVSTRQYGKGRVLAVTTDTTWHWDFKAAGAGQDNRHYYKFWGNAIRWLIRDPELKPIKVKTDRDRYPLGRTVEIMTQVMGSDYQPAQEVMVELKIRHQGSSDASEQPIIKVITGKTSDAGEFITRFTPERDGPWTVTATADTGSDSADQDVFVVATDPVELRDTSPRPKTLEALAKAGGGDARTIDDGLAGLERVTPEVLKVNRRKDVPIWSSVGVLFFALIFPCLEWFLRRRWGLL